MFTVWSYFHKINVAIPMAEFENFVTIGCLNVEEVFDLTLQYFDEDVASELMVEDHSNFYFHEFVVEDAVVFVDDSIFVDNDDSFCKMKIFVLIKLS